MIFQGFVISKARLSFDFGKVKVINYSPKPINKHDIRNFLNLVNFTANLSRDLVLL